MQLFIKAAEIWHPEACGKSLILSSYYYGDLYAFAAASKVIDFDYGEGSSGQAWTAQKPLIWTTGPGQ